MSPTLSLMGDPVLDRLLALDFDPRNIAAMRSLFEQLPSAQAAGFEWTLGAGQSSLDFLACYRTGDHAMQQAVAQARLPASCHWLLNGVRAYDADVEERSPFWLEFDLSNGDAPPSLFISSRGAQAEKTIRRIDRALMLSAATEQTLAQLAELPPPASLFQVGWMPHRHRQRLRACVDGLSIDSLRAFLSESGWPGEWEPLAHTIRPLAAEADYLCLGLDLIDGKIDERIGIEYAFAGAKTSISIRRWYDLLQHATKQELCTAAERDRLLDWPGPLMAPPADSPFAFRATSILNPVVQLSIECGLHHLKTLHWGGQTVAKAYFGFALYLRPRDVR